jgi:hypothetical protein
MEHDQQTGAESRPISKPTAEQIAERVEYVARLLRGQLPKYRIRELFRARYGSHVHWRTVDNYVVRAREAIRREEGIDPKREKQSSLDVYRSIVSDPEATRREKILAQERIDKLLGLESPQRVETVTPPAVVLVSVRTREEARELELRESNGPQIVCDRTASTIAIRSAE